MPKQTMQQFGQSIKAKHPEYKDMDDTALAKAVLAKYPQYSDMVEQGATPPSTIDELTTVEPFDKRPGLLGHVETVGHNLMSGVLQPLRAIEHPEGMGDALTHSILGTPQDNPNPTGSTSGAIEQGIGNLALGMGANKAMEVPGLIRGAAQGNPDAAALRALNISKGSTDALRTLDAVEGARPFLKGTKDIAEAQTRIPAAKEEIWKPYQDAIDTYGARPVKGPDGMTTIGELEQERLQLSAINRGLRTGDPASLQLAEQKGLNQATALEREQAVKAALDPALENAGIKPGDIRKAFGQVSEVGSNVLGRSTLLENSPSGLGRISNIELSRPRSWIGEPMQGMRDLLAGRPIWSAQPSDVNFGEAFRTGGPKPDFGAVKPNNPFLLPENATVREGEESTGPWNFGTPTGGQVTPSPAQRLGLPATAGAGEAQPMIGVRQGGPEELNSSAARTRIRPTEFSMPEILPPLRSGTIAPNEAVRIGPRGLLNSGTPETPAPTANPIYPPGSENRDIQMSPYYPPGSQYRRLLPEDLEGPK